MPELPARFEDPAAAAAAIAATWQQAGASGVVALRAGRLVGYMLGQPVIDQTWGRSARVQAAAYRLARQVDRRIVWANPCAMHATP